MNEKLSRDIAKARSFPTPALAKKKIVLASLKPKPPMEIGNKVMAPIIGKKTKKYTGLILIPKARAVIKKVTGQQIVLI